MAANNVSFLRGPTILKLNKLRQEEVRNVSSRIRRYNIRKLTKIIVTVLIVDICSNSSNNNIMLRLMLQCLRNSRKCEDLSMEIKWARKRIPVRKFLYRKPTINCKLKTLQKYLERKITSICSSNYSIKRDLADLIAQSDNKCNNSNNSSNNKRHYNPMLHRKLLLRRRQGSLEVVLLPVRSNLTVCSIIHNRPIVHQHRHHRFKCRLKPCPSISQLIFKRSQQETIKSICRLNRPYSTSTTSKVKPSRTLHQHQDQKCP